MYRSHCMQFPCYAYMLDLFCLVILIYVTIDKFSYDINVTKIALILYLYNRWTKLFSYAFGYNSKLFRLIRLCISRAGNEPSYSGSARAQLVS